MDEKMIPLLPHEISQLDQTVARYSHLTSQLVVRFLATEKALKEGDIERATEGSQQTAAQVIQEFPDCPGDALAFMLFLIRAIAGGYEREKTVRLVTETTLRGVTLLLPDDHPIRQLPGMDAESGLAALRRVAAEARREKFTTGTGVELFNVHPESECVGQWCVIHRPAPGPWSSWDTHWEEDGDGDGRMFRVCPHAVMHPVVEDQTQDPFWLTMMWQEAIPAHEHLRLPGCDCACDLTRVEVVRDDATGEPVGFKAKGN